MCIHIHIYILPVDCGGRVVRELRFDDRQFERVVRKQSLGVLRENVPTVSEQYNYVITSGEPHPRTCKTLFEKNRFIHRGIPRYIYVVASLKGLYVKRASASWERHHRVTG